MWLILFSDLNTRKKLELNNLFKIIIFGQTAIFAICFSKCSLSQLCIWKDYKMCMIKDFMHLYADSIPSCPPTKVILIIVLFFSLTRKRGISLLKSIDYNRICICSKTNHTCSRVWNYIEAPPQAFQEFRIYP